MGWIEFHDYFTCDVCQGRDFKIVYNFSLRFHKVNFSDDLIYDRMTGEMYQCTNCRKTFTKQAIERGLSDIRKKHKRS